MIVEAVVAKVLVSAVVVVAVFWLVHVFYFVLFVIVIS